MDTILGVLAAVQNPAFSRARMVFITVFCIGAILVPATCVLVPAQENRLTEFNGTAHSVGLNSQDRFAAEISGNPVVQWIADHAVRLKTPEAGHGFADMQPLKNIVGNARIVALGEATHGTREFFQLKHRMLEFLATEMGFSIFSIEANMPEAYRLNDFVLNGRGDPASLIKGMYFWTWDTQEVLDMVLWMREFNKSGKGRLQFTGFDMQTPNVAMGIVNDFLTGADPAYADSLHQVMDMARNANPSASGSSFGVATGMFPVKDAAGKRVRFSGYIKTENVTTGYAGLWWRVDGPSGSSLAFDNMQGRGATGTTDWKRFEIELPVAPEATNINFGTLFSGEGTAWFDALTIELNGIPYTNDKLFDLDFESSPPKGFYTGGNGYQVQLDFKVFRSGTQSLRMTKLPVTNLTAVDPATASSTWRGVVDHMESSREAYQKKGFAPANIEWAIQNARVVRQCMQMQAKEISRDDSMAQNIQWILDQNPGAKVVLWAHNGHVSTNDRAMGASLRRMYGNQMVVFGFAFNQGSFQAIEQSKGLHSFTVPPAPAGSLDATFAAAGIPLFALDLRAIPKTGPVAEWFNQPHQARSIGAIFSDSTAEQYLINLNATQSFDAMLFVEKTTAARSGP